MTNRGPVFLILAMAVLIGCSTATVAQTIYDIEGAVYGPDSNAIPNVLVTLETQARAQIDQNMTNSDGRYRFGGVAAGIYYISAKANETEFQPSVLKIELINTAVNITNYATERVDFSLKYAPRRSDLEPAGTVFAQAIPPEAEKAYLAAINSLAKSDKAQAAAQLKKALEIFPTYFLALQRLGSLLVESERYEDAVVSLRKAIEVNAKGTQSHLELGVAYVNLDQLKEGIAELNVALRFDPKLVRAHLYLGMALIAVGDLDSAEKALKQAYALGGPTQGRAAHLYLASIYSMRKQYQKAINEMEAYLRENPKAPNAAKIQEAIQKLKAKL